MSTISGISGGDADVTHIRLATTADLAVSTGARAAASGATRMGDLEAWTFPRVEDIESFFALLESYRRHGTLAPDSIHSVDRLIAKLTVASRS